MGRKTDFYEQKEIVRLISSASLDVYPNNTTIKFTNVLPTPLNVPKTEGWRVCLSSIICSNRFSRNSKVDFLKIHCEQISPQFGKSKILSTHAREHFHKKRNRVHVFTPKYEEYFDLAADTITEFTISILDNFRDKPLSALEIGQPTIVTLKLRKFSMPNKKIHTVRVSNKDIYGQYEEQAANNFFTSLPNEISLSANSSGKWSVALSSITFKTDFEKLQEKDSQLTLTVYKEDNFEEIVYEKSITIPITQFANETQFDEFMSAIIRRVNADNDTAVGYTYQSFYKKSSLVVYKPSILNLPFDLAKIMGSHILPDKDGRVIIKCRKTAPGEFLFFKNEVDINFATPNTLLLYTNFTKPSPMGSVFAPILKLIPINFTVFDFLEFFLIWLTTQDER